MLLLLRVIALTAVVSGGLVGLLWLVDEIGDRREAQVVARYEARDAKIAEDARKAGEEAVSARMSAAQPGAALRLKVMWCRDCGGQP